MKKEGYSIIISAYGSYNYIKECLDSVQRQSFFKYNNNYEILLGIDNCDKTLEKVKEIKENYDNLKVFYMKKNVGTYITCNTLIDNVSYDKILRFDSDDIMCDDMIENINKHIFRTDILRIKFVDFYDKLKFEDKLKIKKKKAHKSTIAHGIVCFKHSVFDKLGGYMSWKTSADTEIMRRSENFFKSLIVHRPLFFRRIHKSSLTNNSATNHGSNLRKVYKKQIKETNYKKLIYIKREVSKFNIV